MGTGMPELPPPIWLEQLTQCALQVLEIIVPEDDAVASCNIAVSQMLRHHEGKAARAGILQGNRTQCGTDGYIRGTVEGAQLYLFLPRQDYNAKARKNSRKLSLWAVGAKASVFVIGSDKCSEETNQTFSSCTATVGTNAVPKSALLRVYPRRH